MPEPGDHAIIRLVGALMLRSNDERAVARCYMSLEAPARHRRSRRRVDPRGRLISLGPLRRSALLRPGARSTGRDFPCGPLSLRVTFTSIATRGKKPSSEPIGAVVWQLFGRKKFA